MHLGVIMRKIELSIFEARDAIGLQKVDENTFQLENCILRLEADGISVKDGLGSTVSAPKDSYFTTQPYHYAHNGHVYLITNEAGQLVIYKQETKTE